MKYPKEVKKLIKDGFKVDQELALGDVIKFLLSKEDVVKTVTIKNNIVVIDSSSDSNDPELLGLLAEEINK